MNKIVWGLLALTTAAIAGVAISAASRTAGASGNRKEARRFPVEFEGQAYEVVIDDLMADKDLAEVAENRYEWRVYVSNNLPLAARHLKTERTDNLELAEAEARDWIAANR